MPKKVYKIGKEYAVGVFVDGELQRGLTPRYYKTKAGAERALKRK